MTYLPEVTISFFIIIAHVSQVYMLFYSDSLVQLA